MSILPDLSKYLDCEEKRHLQNLAEKLDLHLQSKNLANNNNISDLQEERNKIWWEMNKTMGELRDKKAQESKQNYKWWLSVGLSIIAIVISVISLVTR